MTKKDFISVSFVIKKALLGAVTADGKKAICALAYELADAFYHINPRFDYHKWNVACGLEDK